MSVLSTQHLSIGYSTKKGTTIVQPELNLGLESGELVCLIGPNGTGKSTLLRTLAGIQKPLKGRIDINGVDIELLSHHEKSLLIALVLTDRIDIENATVYDIVSYGRHPYSNWWGKVSYDDHNLISDAIEMVHLSHKKDVNFSELSDGERQRVMIAKSLAQDTPIIILDEPTAHLDLPNRVEIMLLLHKLAHNTGKAVLLSTHELDMALQAADRIWLITSESGVECGVPEDMVFDGSFDRAFRSNAYYFNTTNGNFSMNYPLTKKVWVAGDKTRIYWTLRALARAGYMVVPDAGITINIDEKAWYINENCYLTIRELLHDLDHFVKE